MEASTFAAKDDNDSHAPMTAQEEKELRRVFDLLCNYNLKYKLRCELADLEAWQSSVRLQGGMIGESGVPPAVYNPNNTNPISIEALSATTDQRIEQIKQELAALDARVDSKIVYQDVLEMHKFLDKKITKNEAEEMIWEVDEDLDGSVSWAEFRIMFGRNVTDETGLEPSRLFNLAQYLIYDHNQNGRVSVDGTMHMLFAR